MNNDTDKGDFHDPTITEEIPMGEVTLPTNAPIEFVVETVNSLGGEWPSFRGWIFTNAV